MVEKNRDSELAGCVHWRNHCSGGREEWTAIWFCFILMAGVAVVEMTTGLIYFLLAGLPWWLSSNETACRAAVTGDVGSIPGSG